MLLHEPEAAAMASIKHQMHPVPFAKGNTFVVVDAGGGTVDITTHEVSGMWRACVSLGRACCTPHYVHPPSVCTTRWLTEKIDYLRRQDSTFL